MRPPAASRRSACRASTTRTRRRAPAEPDRNAKSSTSGPDRRRGRCHQDAGGALVGCCRAVQRHDQTIVQRSRDVTTGRCPVGCRFGARTVVEACGIVPRSHRRCSVHRLGRNPSAHVSTAASIPDAAHTRPPRHENGPRRPVRDRSVEATIGFEPMNRGFADLRVRPLRHVARWSGVAPPAGWSGWLPLEDSNLG